MAQVVSYQVPAHPSGLDMRTQLNAIVLAMIGDSSGPTQPAELYPGMWWGDTTAMQLKRRTNANDAWVVVGPLDDFLSDIRKSASDANNNANNKVSKAGDTMTGALWCPNYGFPSGNIMYVSGTTFAITNAGNTRQNFTLNDGGTGYFAGGITSLKSQTGGLNVVGSANAQPGANQGTYINWNESAMHGESDFVNNHGGGDGGFVFRSVNANNSQQTSYTSIDPTGQLIGQSNFIAGATVYSGAGASFMTTDGNLYGSVWGGYLSTWINNNKAVAGATCQWGNAIQETGPISTTWDAPAPYVLVGVRGGTAQATANFIFIRWVYLRNQ